MCMAKASNHSFISEVVSKFKFGTSGGEADSKDLLAMEKPTNLFLPRSVSSFMGVRNPQR